MNQQEIYQRLKIGLSLVVGFIVGKLSAAYFNHHASEFFSAGFLLGVLFAQAFFGMIWRKPSA